MLQCTPYNRMRVTWGFSEPLHPSLLSSVIWHFSEWYRKNTSGPNVGQIRACNSFSDILMVSQCSLGFVSNSLCDLLGDFFFLIFNISCQRQPFLLDEMYNFAYFQFVKNESGPNRQQTIRSLKCSAGAFIFLSKEQGAEKLFLLFPP